MIELKQTAVFAKWETRLRDKRARTIIAARLMRLAEGLPGDVEPAGEGVSYAVATKDRKPVILPPRINSPRNGAKKMTEKLTTYDPAAALVDNEEIAAFMADAFESGDAAYVAKALGVVARAKGMTEISRKTGLSREQLYRSFSEHGNPTLKTTLAVMRALGVDMTAKAHAAQ